MACVMCLEEFDKITFEQRLVDDTFFCARCWTEIMNAEYDSDFDLAEMTQKRGD